MRASSLATVISKGTTPKGGKAGYTESGVNFLRVENICNDGTISHEKIKHITEDMHMGFLKRSILQKDDVLISIAGTLGRTAIVRKVDIPMNTNQAICFFRIRGEQVKPQYIKYAFDNPVINAHLMSQAKITAIPNLTLEIIGNCPLPIPPEQEQSRIVARIESLFAKLDEAKEKIQEVLDGADLRRAAILHQAFTGKLTEKWRSEHNIYFDSWEKKKLGDIGALERGRSKHRPRNDPKLFGGRYPFIQTGDIAAAGMYITTHKQTLSDIGFQQSRLFPAGTLCITIAANIGDVAILSYDCCFPDSVAGFNPHEGQVLSEYVYYLMTVIQQELEANAPATAQKNINLKVLNDVVVTVPTVPEQQEIVRLLDNLLSREQSTVTACEEALTTIDTLKKSILAHAFRGELGTNDPAEPNAKELLKEILSA